MAPPEPIPFLKIVTRPASDDEIDRFDHPRMPLLAPPLFAGKPVPIN
jgi:hypothetical protein